MKVFHKLLKLGSGFVVLGAVVILAGVVFSYPRFGMARPTPLEETIYTISNGFHTALVLPVESPLFNWNQTLGITKADESENQKGMNSIKWLAFGWGERSFFLNVPTWDDLTVPVLVDSLFFSKGTLVQVNGLTSIEASEHIKPVKVSREGYEALAKYVYDTFKLDNQQKPIFVSSGMSSNEMYYEAKGQYSVIDNCNAWTARGLRKANIDTPLWPVLAYSVMVHLD